jgi:two-component system, OmpR family, sensor histidine kinase BaeS
VGGGPARDEPAVSTRLDRDRLAFIVHEVRSPVAALAAIAETYGNERTDDDGRRSLARLALAACRGIERLVADIAWTSVTAVDVDLARLVTETADAAALRGIRVRPVVESDLPAVQADPDRLRQALDNLVANAVTHGRSKEVVLRAFATEDEIVLAVTDEGAGIPAFERERIFEPGVRLDPARPGSGLGLAVVRAIAEAHGARLELESEPGRGSTFSLALPRSRRPQA